MLEFTEILALLTDVGLRFPVDRWKIGKIHVWPLLRHEVTDRNFELISRATKGAPPPVSGLRRFTASAVQWARASALDLRRNASMARRVDALFFSDGVSFVELGGTQYEKFCDPIITVFEARGLSTCMITPLDRCPVPRFSSSAFVQPALNLTSVASAIGARAFAGHLPRKLDGFEDALTYLRQRGATNLPCAHSLERAAIYVEVFAAAYRLLLAAARPRVVFMPCYVGAERMAMNVACRRSGVLSVDVQHGAAGATHWAYSGFGKLPAGGYELLPTAFWCWTSGDAAAIRSWAPPGSGHEAIVAGVPLLEAWLADEVPGTEEARARLRAVPGRDGKKQVVFALSGFETTETLERLARLAARNASRWFCWFRCHPVRVAQVEKISAILKQQGVQRASSAHLATRLPLYALLEQADAVVVELSSTAIEAAMLGVPVVMTQAATGEVYREIVASGWARVASDDLTESVELAFERGKALARLGEPAESIEAGVEWFVARVSGHEVAN